MIFKKGIVSIEGVKSIHKIVYNGEGVSSNVFYAGSASKQGWGKRKGVTDKYHEIFRTLLLEARPPMMTKFALAVFYQSKHDPDNVNGTMKLFLDVLKTKKKKGIVVQKGWVEDDSKKFNKGVSCWPDDSLENNTFEFYILNLE